MKNLKENDFNELEKANKIGFIITIIILIFLVIIISWGLYFCTVKINNLEEELTKKEILLSECRKTSYNRFKRAIDLGVICDRFKSSKNAKDEMIKNSKKIIE